MNRVIKYSLFLLLLISCEKDEFNVQKAGKLKTKYIYSSSTDSDPYSFTTYYYDDNWNLLKELISDYPKPVWASYIYEYSKDGQLLNKQRWAIEGLNSPDQTEADFILLWEKKYHYIDNKQIEVEYRRGTLSDSVIFIYRDNLITAEYHYDVVDFSEWNIIYEYDSNNNLIKRTTNPNGFFTMYYYTGSKINKTLHYNQNDSLLVENTFTYTQSNNKEIVEIHYKGPYGEYISAKITYKDGNIIEYIKYHPTFQGAEWWCERYEYY